MHSTQSDDGTDRLNAPTSMNAPRLRGLTLVEAAAVSAFQRRGVILLLLMLMASATGLGQ